MEVGCERGCGRVVEVREGGVGEEGRGFFFEICFGISTRDLAKETRRF